MDTSGRLHREQARSHRLGGKPCGSELARDKIDPQMQKGSGIMDGASKPHGHALRRGRVSLPGHYYLLTTATLRREPVFDNLFAARHVVCELIEAEVDTLAYVVMPDHLHWLITLQDVPLPRVMQVMKSRSAIAVNRCLHRSGRLWQDGYHDHALRKEENIRTIARYIVANPLRARLVDDIGDYPLWDAMWL